jgi:hypothetical protein
VAIGAVPLKADDDRERRFVLHGVPWWTYVGCAMRWTITLA